MTATNPYTDVSTTPDPVIHRVRQDLLSLQAAKSTDANVIGVVAEEEVLALWPCPVKTFIPVLALRAARSRLFPDASVAPASLSAIQAEPEQSPVSVARSNDEDGMDMGDDVLDLSNDVLIVD